VERIEQTTAYRGQLVRGLNRALLGSALGADVVRQEVAFLAAGGAVEQLEAALLAAPNYYQKAGGTIVHFLRALYRDVFGQSLDRRGRQRYVPVLKSAGTGLAAEVARFGVAEQLLQSAAGRTTLVQRLEQRFLGHPGDGKSVRALVRALGRGLGQDQVLARLVGSNAYLARLLARLAVPSPPVTPPPVPQSPSGGSPPAAPGIVNEAVTTDPGVQQMPSVAVDPHDSQHVVIAYMDYSLVKTGYAGLGVAVSHDGGTTWQHTAVPLPAGYDEGAANPIVHFDDQGHVFVSFMATTFLGPKPGLTNPSIVNDLGVRERTLGFQANNGVFVARSDDGGLTWGQPAAVATHGYDGQHQVPFDIMPDLAIDTFRDLPNGLPNPNYGNLYAVWSRYYPPGLFPGEPTASGGSEIEIAVSHDGGRSWQTQLQLRAGSGALVTVLPDSFHSGIGPPAGLGASNWSHVSVGPEGDVYVALFDTGKFSVYHSTDGGQSFVRPDFTTGRGLPFANSSPTPYSPDGLPTNHFRLQVVRAIAADPARPGSVYVAESDIDRDASGTIRDPGDVIFARSSDYGLTWQTTVRLGGQAASVLNDENDGQLAQGLRDDVASAQVMPRLVTDAQGDVGVIWYDTRHDPANHLLDVYATFSTDGGQTFSPNVRVSDVSFDADAGKFIDAEGKTDYYLGDFVGLDLASHTAYAAWTDTRAGNQDVFFRRLILGATPPPATDRFEPNDTPQKATDLGAVVTSHLPKLDIPTGDQDWFRVRTTATGSLTVSATQEQAGVSPRLEFYDASGRDLLAASTDERDASGQVIGQQIVFPSPAGRTFLVRVLPAASAGANGPYRYALDVESLTANLGTQVHDLLTGSLASDDAVSYLLAAGAGGSLQATVITAAGFAGNVQLQLLDPSTLAVLASAQGSGAAATLQASAPVKKSQAVLLRVSGGATTAGDFALGFTNLDEFTTPQNKTLFFSAGHGSSEVAVADLDRDGKPDLVVTDALSNTVSVLPGNGDGTFQAPRQFEVGAFAPAPAATNNGIPNFGRAVAVADVSGGGMPDVIVTNYASSDISVLLGRGDGTFEPQRRFQATVSPFALAAGDINGDGIPDVVVIDSGAAHRQVGVLLGRGDGTFQPPLRFPSPLTDPVPLPTLKIADVNRDGRNDLVIASGTDKMTHVLLGNGDGTFRPGHKYQAFGPGLAIADLNGDGTPDVVNTQRPNDTASYFLGNGDGTFASFPSVPAGQSPISVAVADLGSNMRLPDGSSALGPPDGHPDLIIADVGDAQPALFGPPAVIILPGLVDAQGRFAGFGSPFTLATPKAPQYLQVADLNGDGVPDVVVVDRDGILVIFPKPPVIPPNNTPQTARNLGTVVHVVEPTQTIVPGHSDAYYTLTVPTEAAQGAGDEVLDFSGLFQATEGAGISMEVRDPAGNQLGDGVRFRVVAPQGEQLTLHVFGVAAPDGSRGAGAYTLDIETLPQVVSVEAQPLLPGQGGAPGGPTASIVLTLQGDRLDPAAAQDPANYTVTWAGPDGILGTPDDQVIPLAATQGAVYDPSTNVDVGSGKDFPTAVRQTVTLLFDQPLPPGSYQVQVAPAVVTAPFNADEAGLLTPAPGFTGHPVVSLAQGQVTEGVTRVATGLVQAAGALGDFAAWKAGTPFLSQLHDDLGALLDAQLTSAGDAAGITGQLLAQVQARLGPAAGAVGQRPTGVVVLWLDPVSLDVTDPSGMHADYNQGTGALSNGTGGGYVNVGGNIDVVVLPASSSQVGLQVSDVPATARGGLVFLGPQGNTQQSLTDPLRAGTTSFTFTL
jgi:hypothetical protein